MTRQLGNEVSRGTMAQWVMAVAGVIAPLIKRLRVIQNQGDYLQADETRIQVLKEAQKSPHADKWMWVTRGGPLRCQRSASSKRSKGVLPINPITSALGCAEK